MNERMMRWAPKSAAEFITAFSDGKGQLGDSTWLVWAYEGDYTLADLMQVQYASAGNGCRYSKGYTSAMGVGLRVGLCAGGPHAGTVQCGRVQYSIVRQGQ